MYILPSLKKISPYISKHLLALVIVLISILGVALSILSIAQIIKDFVDHGLSAADVDTLNNTMLKITFLIIILAISSFFRSYFINRITENMSAEIRKAAFLNILRWQYKKFELISDGEIITRLNNDIDSIGKIITDILSFSLRNSILFIGGLTMMFYENIILAGITITVVPVTLVVISILGRKVRLISRQLQGNIGGLFTFIGETIRGVQTIYAINGQESRINLFGVIDKKIEEMMLRKLRLRSMFFALVILAISMSVVLVLWLGSKEVIEGTMSAGQLLSFIIYSAYCGFSLGGLMEVSGNINRHLAGIERVFEIIDNKDFERNQKTDVKLAEITNISFNSLSFSYPTRTNILALEKLDLDINKESLIGIVGKSGSGKSTIGQLLFKFYNDYDGEIKINGNDIKNISNNQIREKIAYVPQHPFIFSDTILSNILLNSDPNIYDQDKLNNILNLLELKSLIDDLPDGLNTNMGLDGRKFSGGQKQKIAIARALLMDPEILFLDEAMSALDHKSSANIMSNLLLYMKGRAIIAISHRITSIMKANQIFVVNKGSVISSGKHNELKQKCDLYNQLVEEEIKG